MAIKLVVVYPHPTDKDAFEQRYLSKHVPTMHGFKVETYRTIDSPVNAPDGKAPYHRVAVIEFRDVQHFNEFMQSEQAKIAVDSALKISTGGPPLFLLCKPDA